MVPSLPANVVIIDSANDPTLKTDLSRQVYSDVDCLDTGVLSLTSKSSTLPPLRKIAKVGLRVTEAALAGALQINLGT